MATRSTIALEFADGTVQQVYCHWDGYLDHNGRILLESYSDPFKLRDLIDQGDISSLGREIGVQRPFSNPNTYGSDAYKAFEAQYENQCVFYSRDRDEKDVSARKFKDIADYNANCQGEEYDYILCNRDGKAQWYVRYYDTQENWIPIEHAFENERKAA
jgi:hypothetical protein